MNKSLQLTLCDTQGKLFELSGERGYDSETFIRAFMTTDISKDMDTHIINTLKILVYAQEKLLTILNLLIVIYTVVISLKYI